jgi:hypothetical protein
MFRRVVFVSVLLSALSLFAQDAHPHITAHDKEHIFDGDFTTIRTTNDIPKSIKAAFIRITDQKEFAMADPGRPFQVTDAISDESLPWRRLIFAANQNGRWLVHYEKGGIGHSYYMFVFQVRSNDKADLIWGAALGIAAKDLKTLRTQLRMGGLDDEMPYIW